MTSVRLILIGLFISVFGLGLMVGSMAKRIDELETITAMNSYALCLVSGSERCVKLSCYPSFMQKLGDINAQGDFSTLDIPGQADIALDKGATR